MHRFVQDALLLLLLLSVLDSLLLCSFTTQHPSS